MSPTSFSLRRHAPTAGFLLLAALWGGSFVAIEVGLHYFPTFLFAALRYALAGVVVLGFAALRPGRTIPRTRGDLETITVSGLFVIAAYHAFLYAGEEHVSGAVAAVVISLAPILTAGVASVVLPNQRVTPLQAGGFALGLAGVVIVASPDTATIDSSLVGISFVFLSALTFSIGSVLTRPITPSIGMAAQQAWAMLAGSLVLGVGALGAGESMAAISWTPTAVASFLYLTFGSAVVGFAIYFSLLDSIGPMRLNMVGYLEPIAAVGVAWLLLGDVVSPTTLLGFLVIFLGFAAINYDGLRRVAIRTQRWTAKAL